MNRVFTLILCVIVIFGLIGCSSVEQEEASKIIEMVKVMEQNGHQLERFEITYDQYKENTDSLIASGFTNKEKEVLFGFDGKMFTGKTLTGVTREEMLELKEALKNALKDSWREAAYDTVYISDVYDNDTFGWKYVLTKETITFENMPDTIRYKKYMFKQSDDGWKIFDITDMTTSIDRIHPKEVEQYEKRNGEAIKYTHRLDAKN
ncbi:uncharacterized protein YceK [Anaerosolibacter carboniphilus]|uniref:Uncharacterized protein YceK n=1 Tax=Anaerosolibacter carboniphilus TaxID=1417629 RepID=A0A841KYW6_9FIRM|nr:hypothetical protein [Anaerosolibacter carboniphilus]MBB6218824.1 uncharacterized protein YceK [Anaerosolibacter carboniphilus]